MNIIQIGVAGVIGAVLAIQFRSGKSEYGIYISIGISIFIFLSIVSRLQVIIDMIARIGSYIEINMAYIPALIKMLGVTYVAEFASGICKDAGYQTIASQIEIFGKLTILALSMPILLALLETIHRFLG